MATTITTSSGLASDVSNTTDQKVLCKTVTLTLNGSNLTAAHFFGTFRGSGCIVDDFHEQVN